MKTPTMAILALFLSVAVVSGQEKIVVGGSGSINEELADLAKAYMAKHPGAVIEVRPESMSTEGGMEGVRTGRFHIGVVSRPPNASEKGGLVYLPVSRSMAGVVVHKSTPVSDLSDHQVCDVFSGRIKSWKEIGGHDAKILVLTRKRDDSNTEAFRKKMPCFKDLAITPDAIALLRGNEVLDALDKRPGTIGITNLGSNFRDHENLKALAINGISPTPETVRNDKYRFIREQGIVTAGEPHGLAKRFIDFMATAEGRKVLGSQGAIPLR
ncbi:MAG TPA: substrate-binding domain-containing protein [Candidatus Binatia bacterium]|nr:substrate-binding domain-containing protein [Candidatus Binatia bacterium]